MCTFMAHSWMWSFRVKLEGVSPSTIWVPGSNTSHQLSSKCLYFTTLSSKSHITSHILTFKNKTQVPATKSDDLILIPRNCKEGGKKTNSLSCPMTSIGILWFTCAPSYTIHQTINKYNLQIWNNSNWSYVFT